MFDLALRVENLSKLYHIVLRLSLRIAQKRHDTLRDVIGSWKIDLGATARAKAHCSKPKVLRITEVLSSVEGRKGARLLTDAWVRCWKVMLTKVMLRLTERLAEDILMKKCGFTRREEISCRL